MKMTESWERLHSVATEALPWLWYDFAKEGREGAVLAPLAKYPKAAGWLARSMAMSDDDITRKLTRQCWRGGSTIRNRLTC